MKTKTCSICLTEKPITEFHNIALGVTTRGCVVCVKKPVVIANAL